MCRRPKRKCLESYIQLNNWHFPNIQRQLWIIPYYDLGLFTKKPTISQYILTPPSSFKTLWNKHWKFCILNWKERRAWAPQIFYFVVKKKKKNEGVHRNSKCPHKRKLFHVHTGRTKTKNQKIPAATNSCPLMLKLRKSRVNIREVNSQRNLQVPNGVVCPWSWSKSLAGRGSRSCQEAKPCFSALTAKNSEHISLVLSSSHSGSLVWPRESPKNPQWEVLCSEFV